METKDLSSMSGWLYTDPGHLRVIEMYPCIQGEGIRVGTPTIMIRVPGCLVHCTFCDTKYSWKANQGELVEPVGIVSELLKIHPTLLDVSITGGEPLEQNISALLDLINMFLLRGYHVTLETSGTSQNPDFSIGAFVQSIDRSNRFLLSMAPKLPSAQAAVEMADLQTWLPALSGRGFSTQLKFVVKTLEDLQEVSRVLRGIDYIGSPVNVILQVMSDISIRDLNEFREETLGTLRLIQEDFFRETQNLKLPVWARPRFLAQTHSLIYGPKERLV